MARRYPELAHLPPKEYRAATRNKSRANRRAAGEKVDSGKHRPEYYRERRYGVTTETFGQMLKEQGGHCAICPATEDLVVDHCHDGGHVRGILCRKCNVMLGMAEDNAERLAAAIRYLT